MRKIRKNTQLTITNPKGAGRPAKIDKGIRHTKRERIQKPNPLHLTIKVRKNKADIKSKLLLKALHHAIKRARLKSLHIIHYSLEYDHLHLLVEAKNNKVLHAGMQALGISLSKAINRIKHKKGTVYKHRYHLRTLSSARELRNVLHYIFNNGIKHGRTKSQLDPYNSKVVDHRNSADIKKIIRKSVFLSRLKDELKVILDPGAVTTKLLTRAQYLHPY
ncbi:MAG: transposase [Bacteriovorax sp.]|jgi:REP element-mobilizing transposase RayT